MIIESFKIRIDFHLKWHPFGVPWKINGGISEWTAVDYLASSLQPFFPSVTLRKGWNGSKYRNIGFKGRVFSDDWLVTKSSKNKKWLPNGFYTNSNALWFSRRISKMQKFESESWFKSFFTPSCILNCIKMLYFWLIWLIRYDSMHITWQVDRLQTWESSGFKDIWFQISKVKFLKSKGPISSLLS